MRGPTWLWVPALGRGVRQDRVPGFPARFDVGSSRSPDMQELPSEV